MLVLGLLLPPVSASPVENPEPLAALEAQIREGHYEEALQVARRLLERTEAEQGPDSDAVAEVLYFLVEASWRSGVLTDEIRELAERAVAIREKNLGPDHADTGRSLNGLANFTLMTGNYPGARELYERAVRIYEATDEVDDEDLAKAYNNLGLSLYVLNDFEGARENYEKALAIREEVLGADHPKLARNVMNLGLLLRRQNDFAAGRRYMERALAIVEKAYGGEHPDAVLIHTNLGVLFVYQGMYEEAVPHLEFAVEQNLKNHGPDHPDVAFSMNPLGVSLWHLGERRRARELFEESLRIREQVLGEDHPELAPALISYAFVLREEGRYDDALALYTRALELRRRWEGELNLHTAESLIHLAELHRLRGENTQALDRALEAEKVARTRFQIVAASLSEEEALRFEVIRASGLDLALAVLVSTEDAAFGAAHAGQVWNQLVDSRALVLDEMAVRRRSLLGAEHSELAPLVVALEQARDELAKLIVSGSGGEGDDYLARLERAMKRSRDAERALARKSREFRTRQEGREVGLARVAEALPVETSLVAFVRFDRLGRSQIEQGAERVEVAGKVEINPFYAALVLAPDALPAVVPIGDAATVEDAIETWRVAVTRRPPAIRVQARRSEIEFRSAAQTLRRLLWDPVEPLLGKSRQLIVVPDGAVHLVSFATLPTADGRYLAESGPRVHYVSAERDLVGDRVSSASAGLLALGGPDFDLGRAGDGPRAISGDATADCDRLAALRFEPLHGSRREAEEIAALWVEQDLGESRTLTGGAATEAALKSAAPGNRILHLATHGFYIDDACAAPRATATAGSRLEAGAGTDLGLRLLDNPLLLSGLALAGANRRSADRADGEDGVLIAEEIATLDLTAVDWAVLSACETGIGRVQSGEGVLGLRRAFRTAGAGTLIMSLWAVEDEATRAWMNALYLHRFAGRTTIESVHLATVGSIEARRAAGHSTHPFYWGAFVAAGDWR